MHQVIVYMSTYNGEKYLREQIESILSQKNCKVQLFVRDDGSVDQTLRILEEYNENRGLTFLRGENLGAAKSFLSLVMNSSGMEIVYQENTFFAFADQDDIWDENKIDIAIQKLQRIQDRKPLLYCSNLCVVDENKAILKNKLLPKDIIKTYEGLMMYSPHLFGCTMVWNEELQSMILDAGIPEVLIMHDLWVGLIAACFGEILYDYRTYIAYRQHGNNVSGAMLSFGEKWRSRWKRVVKRRISIIEQARCFVNSFGEAALMECNHWEFSQKILACNTSWKGKKALLKQPKSMMRKKTYYFYQFLVLLGKV